MKATVEMLKTQAIELALGELDRYAGTTVNDLRVFMLRHKLQFADAGTPDERELFPQLYAKLGEQKDRVSVGLAVQDDPARLRTFALTKPLKPEEMGSRWSRIPIGAVARMSLCRCLGLARSQRRPVLSQQPQAGQADHSRH